MPSQVGCTDFFEFCELSWKKMSALTLPMLVYLYQISNNINSFSTDIFNTGNSILFGGKVTTSLGVVKGSKHFSRLGFEFHYFRGIPYAKAPSGNLRFEPPVPHQGWTGVLQANKAGPACMQPNLVTRGVDGSEDCLFINVATRSIPTKRYWLPASPPRLRPVIVYIYGGLFMLGESKIFRPRYWMDEDIVLVTFNYRVASFGFLNTGDGVVAGNMGLKDQNLALRWVRDNIQNFNGDPNKVTIMGESAGSASVHYHTLSRMSWGLFSGAISLSGTALSPWAFVENPREQALEFGELLGCPVDDSNTMVDCLKKLPAEQVAQYHSQFAGKSIRGENSLFGPTVESGNRKHSTFLMDTPLDLLTAGIVSDVPWISGVNSGEGAIYLITIMRNEQLRNILNENWETLAPKFLGYQGHPNESLITAQVYQHYLNGRPISEDNVIQAINMLSDTGFFLDNHDSAILHSRVAPVYLYYLTYNTKFSLSKLLLSSVDNNDLPNDLSYILGSVLQWLLTKVPNEDGPNPYGVCHGDELPLLFFFPFIRQVTEFDVDFDFSRKLAKLFVSFAENGVPNPRFAGEAVDWLPLRTRSTLSVTSNNNRVLRRLQLDQSFTMVSEPFHARLQFWKNLGLSYI